METKINKKIDLFDSNQISDLQFKQYALEDTPVGSTVKMFRIMQGISIGEFSFFSDIDLPRLKDIEEDIIEPEVYEVDKICNCIGIPFNVLILNAILNGDKFDTQFNANLAKGLRPIIHKMTKLQYINKSDPLDEIELIYN